MGLTLAQYMQRTQRLLADQGFQRYNPYDLVEYINEGRQQLAGEAGCVKVRGTLTTIGLQSLYLNSAIVLPSGAAGALAVERIWYIDSNPARVPVLLDGRSWGWFNLYYVTLGAQGPGLPKAWSQYLQGPAGSFYIGPVPFGGFSLAMDVTALPIGLTPQTVGTDVDLIPFPWTDAIPFYAANLALRGAKLYQEADAMLAQYESYIGRAGAGVTPSDQARSFPERSALIGQAQAEPPPQAGTPGGARR